MLIKHMQNLLICLYLLVYKVEKRRRYLDDKVRSYVTFTSYFGKGEFRATSPAVLP